MKNKIYKIIYLSGLLIDNQAHISIPVRDIIIPEDIIINQRINIDMAFLSNSKLLFITCYAVISVMKILIIFFKKNSKKNTTINNNKISEISKISNTIFDNIFKTNYNKDNKKLSFKDNSWYILLQPILLQSIIIPIMIFLGITYIKINSLLKSWLIYMLFMLISLLVINIGWTDLKNMKNKIIGFYSKFILFIIFVKNIFNIKNTILQAINYLYIKDLMAIKSLIFTFIINNLILITSYYMLKGYYYFTPRKYKEKRDYINTLNNNITPANVLDNNLVVENNII